MKKMFWVFGFIAALAVSAIAHASEIPTPRGEVVLTISGSIGKTNQNGSAVFDMTQLKAMPKKKYMTSTIWTDGTIVFEGVLLKDVLDNVENSGSKIRAVALNDYAADLTVRDATEDGPIIAYQMNGEPMSVRQKGPLWIVFPYDDNPEYRTEATYAKSVWQLTRLHTSD